MQYDKITERLIARANKTGDFRVECVQFEELGGLEWGILQSYLNEGRWRLRAMPWDLRGIDQLIHPWVLHMTSAIGFVMPFVVSLVFGSWWMLLTLPFFWAGMRIGHATFIGILVLIAIIPISTWAAYSGNITLSACAGAILVGMSWRSFVCSYNRVFRALHNNETLFSLFFEYGVIKIEDTTTGNFIQVKPNDKTSDELTPKALLRN